MNLSSGRGGAQDLTRSSSPQVNDNLDAPLRLNAIRILGAHSTRPAFLSRIFAPYLSPLPPPSFLSSSFDSAASSASKAAPPSQQTLRSLLKATRQLTETLESFDIYRGIDATLERSDSAFAEREDVDIVLRVKEAPKYFLRTATDVGDGEGTAVSAPRKFATVVVADREIELVLALSLG